MKQFTAFDCPFSTIYSSPEGPGRAIPGPLLLLLLLSTAELPLARSLSPNITSAERLSLSHHLTLSLLITILFLIVLILTEMIFISYCLVSLDDVRLSKGLFSRLLHEHIPTPGKMPATHQVLNKVIHLFTQQVFVKQILCIRLCTFNPI